MTPDFSAAPRLSVTPADGMIDAPRRITASNLGADALVTISASTIRSGGALWESRARFMADAAGTVDLTRDAPVGGDYAEISPMGLIWSQQPSAAPGPDAFADDVMVPLGTMLTLETADGQQSSAGMIQRFAAPGVTRRDIREDGLVGTLFTPAGPGPYPVVVVLNGSGGGINEPRAALYASRGYQALALGYFKAPGLQPFITETPLEYLETGLLWVRRMLKPRAGFVALSGQSRGGELALLLGATWPDLVSAVIAYVPGAMVHGAQGAGDPARGGWQGTTWTRGGKALPHLWQGNSAVDWHPWDGAAPPDRHHSVFFEGLKHRALTDATHPGRKDRRPRAADFGARRSGMAFKHVFADGGLGACAPRARASGAPSRFRQRRPCHQPALCARHADHARASRLEGALQQWRHGLGQCAGR
ncbi:MAG: acyl-CoA thioesterase/BAAT N-terminal domain-containing protein [Paracoccus sp. (in: a-proteobacteria)]|nr:acyl-CoA thioesterase/BAAT N-terminal domain-containing protein [Paracoccus sp. (in: a-proteobacteria)]